MIKVRMLFGIIIALLIAINTIDYVKADFVSNIDVYVNGTKLDANQNPAINLTAGETIPIDIEFSALKNITEKVMIKVLLTGYQESIEQSIILNTPLEEGVNGYRAKLFISIPEYIVTGDSPLRIRFFTKDEETQDKIYNIHVDGADRLLVKIVHPESYSTEKSDFVKVSVETDRNSNCKYALFKFIYLDGFIPKLDLIIPATNMSMTGEKFHSQIISNLTEGRYQLGIICKDEIGVIEIIDSAFYVNLSETKEHLIPVDIEPYKYVEMGVKEESDDRISVHYYAMYNKQDNHTYSAHVIETKDNESMQGLLKELDTYQVVSIYGNNIYIKNEKYEDIYIWFKGNSIIFIVDYHYPDETVSKLPSPLINAYLEKYPSELNETPDKILLTDCGVLNKENGFYELQNDVTVDYHTTSTCFIIGSNNMTLDLNNKDINGGININNHNFTKIKNGNINGNGIDIIGSNNNIFENIHFLNDGWRVATLYLKGSNENLVKDCKFDSNDNAIIISGGSSNKVENVIINSSQIGVQYDNTFDNQLSNLTLKNNEIDFDIKASEDKYCNNILDNVLGSNNKPIIYFNNSVNISNKDLSELILCNADNSNISNINIDTGGVLILRSANSIFSNLTVNRSYFGIKILDSNNNSFSNIKSINNAHTGINIIKGMGNKIFESYIGFNDLGITIEDNNNTIINNTIENNDEGIIIEGDSKYNTISENKFENNSIGLHLENGLNNTIINNFFKSQKSNIMISEEVYNFFNNSYFGNFWANSNGTGFSETCNDMNEDGICDAQYIMDENNTDYLPLHIWDISPPTIGLISPINQDSIDSSEINFKYIVNDESKIINCDLIIDDQNVQTNNFIIKNSTNEFLTDLDPGTYSWKIKCIDLKGYMNMSELRELTVNKNKHKKISHYYDDSIDNSENITSNEEIYELKKNIIIDEQVTTPIKLPNQKLIEKKSEININFFNKTNIYLIIFTLIVFIVLTIFLIRWIF